VIGRGGMRTGERIPSTLGVCGPTKRTTTMPIHANLVPALLLLTLGLDHAHAQAPNPDPPMERPAIARALLTKDTVCTWYVSQSPSAWAWMGCSRTVDTLVFDARTNLLWRKPCDDRDSLRAEAFKIKKEGGQALLVLKGPAKKFRITQLPSTAAACRGCPECVRLSTGDDTMENPTMDIYLRRGAPPAADTTHTDQ